MFPQRRFFSHLSLFSILLLAACGGDGNDKPEPSDIDISDFDAVWYGPCFNNKHDFSARQKITINGTSLISQIKTYANAPAKTPNCTLSASAGSIVKSDITATLTHGNQSQQNSCINNTSVNTSIALVSNQTSGKLINTQPDLGNSIQLLTGRKNDFLPSSTPICLKPNGNLLFAGFEYTRTANPNVISETTTPPVATSPNSAVTWKVGSHRYTGGTHSGSSATTTGCSSCTNGKHNFAVLTTSTSGFSSTNGAYAGSVISISHSLKGARTYTIVERLNDLSSKQVKLSVVIGTGVTTGATGYVAKSGSVDVTVDNQGRYHFTISSPILLSFSSNVLGGVPNPPATIAFTMKNIYNFNP